MSDQETARAKRLREALRENLKRRKSQARGRATPPAMPETDDMPNDDGEEQPVPIKTP